MKHSLILAYSYLGTVNDVFTGMPNTCYAIQLAGHDMPGSLVCRLNNMEDAQKLLDFSQKLDITLLDKVVTCLYNGSGDQVRYICTRCDI